MRKDRQLSPVEVKVLEHLYRRSSEDTKLAGFDFYWISGKRLHNTIIKTMFKLCYKLGYPAKTFPSRKMVYTKNSRNEETHYQTYYLTSAQKKQVRTIVINGGYY